MSLADLAKEYRYANPGHDLICEYEAGIPVYWTQLKASALRKQQLPTIAQFVLRLIDLGINEITKICDNLCLDMDFVRNALLTLDAEQLITKASDAHLQQLTFRVTQKGHLALKSELDTEYVETLQIRVDGYTGMMTNVDGPLLAHAEVLRQQKVLCLSPIVEHRPTVESLNQKLRDLDVIFRAGLEHNRASDQILDVIEIDKRNILYKLVNVLVFQERASKKLEFRVFDGHERNDQYALLLSRCERSGKRVIPEDKLVSMFDIDNTSILETVKPQLDRIEQTCRHIAEVEAQSQHLKQEKEMIERTLEQERTQPDIAATPITARSARIAQLEQQLAQRDQDLATRIQELQRLERNRNRLVQDVEHREILKKALTTVRRRFFIISPWINRVATDEEIIKLIEAALKRGVWIAIGFGMKERQDQTRRTFLDPKVEQQLERMQQRYGDRLYLGWLDTHEKILVCDAQFCVVTSFNWLSYRGEQGFRRETGTYSEDPHFIDDVTRAVMQGFKGLPQGFILND